MLLLAGISVATWAFSTLRPANFGVTRMIGAPYIVDKETVRNQFLVRIVNKRTEPESFMVTIANGPAHLLLTGFAGSAVVPPLGEVVQPLIVQVPRPEYQGPFQIQVSMKDQAGRFHLERQVEFLGPDPRLLREEEAEEAHGAGPH